MLKFLVVFLSIYTAMHALFFFRVRVLLPEGRLVRWLCFLFLFIMMLAPIISRILEKMGHDLFARIIAFAGFYWMGFIFLAFTGFLLLQITDIFLWGINTVTRLNLPLLCGKIPTLAMVGLVTAMCVYGSLVAWDIQIEQLRIVTDKLPAGTDRLRIVQISDVHLGLLVRGKRLKTITDKVKSANPDILVCTGDLVDSDVGLVPELSELFEQVRPKYGKYAVTGNHEYYVGVSHALGFMRRSGFTVLQGKAITIKNLINIVGTDYARDGTRQEVLMLSSVKNNGLFTLFLKHQPLVARETLGLFDLQLSGHTHGGQIFPFNFIVSIPFPFISGFYELPGNSAIYTNRGTGVWGPQMRIFSPAEITLIELQRK